MYAQYVERKTVNIGPWQWLPRETWFPSIVVHHLKQELELLDGFIASGTKRLHEVREMIVVLSRSIHLLCCVSCVTWGPPAASSTLTRSATPCL